MEKKYLLKMQCSGAAFSNMCDRFVDKGYKGEEAALPYEKQCELFAGMGGVGAMSYVLDEGSMDPVKLHELVSGYGMRVGTIAPDNWMNRKWRFGTFSARDPKTRREIVKLGKEAMDYAAASHALDIMFWTAHDGYDYPFQADYSLQWGYMAECIYEIASYRPDVKLTLEYKKYEPLTYQYAGDVSKVLLLCEKIGLDNVGVIVDYGHALFGMENPAESVCLANDYGRLDMIHLNDNYGRADDDLIFGTVSLWQSLEFFWRLDEIGYDGWYIMDNWPARMDGYEATREFIAQANTIMRIAKELPKERIHRYQEEQNVPALIRVLRECTLACGKEF